MSKNAGDNYSEITEKFSQLEMENISLKKKNALLEQYILSLESEYSKIKMMYSSIVSKETLMNNLEKKLLEKEEQIEIMRRKFEANKKDFQNYKLKWNLLLEKDVNQAKYQYDSIFSKIENAQRIEKMFNDFLNTIAELKEALLNAEEEEKKRMQIKEVEFEEKMNNMKKKMLDYIKDGQKNSNSASHNQAELNAKLNLLHNNQLLNELEFQSLQIEELLKERENLDKIIMKLKNEVKVHTGVEKILSEKNKKYTNMIKILSNKIEEKNTFNEMLNLNPSFSFNIMPILNRSLSNSNIQMGKQSSKLVLLQREIIAKQKENSDLKLKIDSIKEKLTNFQMKYLNIINIIEVVLEKIYNDPEFSQLKDIYLNIEEFKNCDFQKMNLKQQYSVGVILIKMLIPIVNEELIENNPLLQKINKVRTSFFIGKDSASKTFSNFYDSKRTTANSFNHIRFNSSHLDYNKNSLKMIRSLSSMQQDSKAKNTTILAGGKVKRTYHLFKMN